MGKPKGKRKHEASKPNHGGRPRKQHGSKMTPQMIASLVRARGKGGKFVSKSQLNSATQKLNDANKNNNGQPQVKRKYNKRLNPSEPGIPKETEIKTGESDVEIDSDDENTVYLFPQETELADNRQQTETMPQRKGDVLRSQAVKPIKKDDVTSIKGKPTHYMTEMRPPVTTPLTLDCDSTNSRSSPTHGLMGPPASTPFTNLRNSVSRPVPRIPISPYTRSPASVSSQQSVTDRDSCTPHSSQSQSVTDTPHTSPTVRRVTRSSPNKPPHQRLPSPGGSTDGSPTKQLSPHTLITYHPTDTRLTATVSAHYRKQMQPGSGSKSSSGFLSAGFSGHSRRSASPAISERRLSVRQTECAYKYKDILVKKTNKFTQIILCTASSNQKNVLTVKALQELTSVLNNAKYDDNSQAVLITGSDNGTFCSGLDLSYLTTGDIHHAAKTMSAAVIEFSRAILMFPKPVVAAVNGQAVGYGVGILALCDIVYASDKATFYTPYTQLGQVPEAGLSYTLSQIIGSALANEMLMAGRMLTALEAYQMGLVAQVFWPTSLMLEVTPRITNMASCSSRVLNATKSLIRSQNNERLLAACLTETNMLAEIWPTPECQRNMRSFLLHCD